MDNRLVKISIQIVLGLLIVFLFFWLIQSITGPWEAQERQREITEMTRDRMSDVRSALVYYERQEDDFPGSLDSLRMWLDADSLMMIAADSIFEAQDFMLDSLFFSPRTGSMFEYTVNDTGLVEVYLLKDPDSDDQIGTLDPDDITSLNAASWE